jgi:hypothetical protein
MSQTSSAVEALRQVSKVKASQKRTLIESLKETVRAVPVRAEDLKKLVPLLGDEIDEVMSCHPGHSLDGKIKSLERTLETYWRCNADLLMRLDEFDVASKDGTLFYPSREAALNEYAKSSRKEIFALSGAAAALVDQARHVTMKISFPEFAQVRTEHFNIGQHTFIKELRNHLNHKSFLEPSWSIKNVGPGQTSHLEFNAAKLLRNNGFTGTAKKYLQDQRAPIDVRRLFETYGQSVRNFYAWLMPEIEIRLPIDVHDYRRCIHMRRAHVARLWYRLVFTQMVTPETDLYGHLPEHLTPKEREEINALPHRSKEQIDRIIEMVDEYGACDEELRALVYKGFGIIST